MFSLFTVFAIDLFLKTRLKEALKDKKAAEKEAGEFKEAKEAVESEKDALKEKVGELEKKLADAHSTVEEGRGELAQYFDDGFNRTKEQVLHFNPDAKVEELDPFKILVNGELIDEE